MEPRVLYLWLVTRHDCLSSVEAGDWGDCLRQPAGVHREAVLHDEEKEGSVDDDGRVDEDEGSLKEGVDGAVGFDDDLYHDGTFSFSMLA